MASRSRRPSSNPTISAASDSSSRTRLRTGQMMTCLPLSGSSPKVTSERSLGSACIELEPDLCPEDDAKALQEAMARDLEQGATTHDDRSEACQPRAQVSIL